MIATVVAVGVDRNDRRRTGDELAQVGPDGVLHPEGHAQPVRGHRRPRRQARAHEDGQQAGRPVRHEGHGCSTAAGDPDRHPDRRQRDRDRGQRPGSALPAAQAGHGQGHRGRHVRLGRELPPALHQPGRHRDHRSQPDPGARQGDGLQGRVRDPLGRLHGDQPERLDQVHEARAQAARSTRT